MREEKRFEFIPFIINLAIPMVFGAVASYVAMHTSKEWVDQSRMSEFIPAKDYLGPFRTLLRVLVGIAAFLIWRRRKSIANYRHVIIIYFISPICSLLWAYLFFQSHLVTASLILVIASIIAALYNIVIFYRINKTAGLLLVVYLAWLIVLANLTWQVFQIQ